MIDSAMFPRLTRYAAGLPDGLKSYPQDRAKASLCRGMLDAFPFAADEIAALPAELRFIAEGAVPVSSWIPEVRSHGILVAIYDLRFETPDGFAEQAYRMQKALFAGPLYAIALKVLSPARLLKTAATRWRMFHRGVTFVVTELGTNHAVARVEHQRGVFEELSRRGTCEGLHAVLDLSTGGGGSVEIDEIEVDFMHLRARWQRRLPPVFSVRMATAGAEAKSIRRTGRRPTGAHRLPRTVLRRSTTGTACSPHS